jgi:hypothetical protein
MEKKMRKIREITAEEENFRVEHPPQSLVGVIKRDPVKPEPEGTVILMPFRIAGYDSDCDGSLMARLEALTSDGEHATGWALDCIGLYPDSGYVVSSEELKKIHEETK